MHLFKNFYLLNDRSLMEGYLAFLTGAHGFKSIVEQWVGVLTDVSIYRL